jgi:hypothetical protein
MLAKQSTMYVGTITSCHAQVLRMKATLGLYIFIYAVELCMSRQADESEVVTCQGWVIIGAPSIITLGALLAGISLWIAMLVLSSLQLASAMYRIYTVGLSKATACQVFLYSHTHKGHECELDVLKESTLRRISCCTWTCEIRPSESASDRNLTLIQ